MRWQQALRSTRTLAGVTAMVTDWASPRDQIAVQATASNGVILRMISACRGEHVTDRGLEGRRPGKLAISFRFYPSGAEAGIELGHGLGE